LHLAPELRFADTGEPQIWPIGNQMIRQNGNTKGRPA